MENNKPLYKFLLTLLVLYVAWFVAYETWIAPYQKIDDLINSSVLEIGKQLLVFTGFEADYWGRYIYIGKDVGVWLGDSCNGLSLFALFSIFIIAYPGKWLAKIPFIGIGILLIHLINGLRVASLCWIQMWKPELLDFNHTYTFTIIVYGFIFGLWMIWVNKFGISFKELREQQDETN